MAPCPFNYDPVWLHNITYSTPAAWYAGGIAQWTPGRRLTREGEWEVPQLRLPQTPLPTACKCVDGIPRHLFCCRLSGSMVRWCSSIRNAPRPN